MSNARKVTVYSVAKGQKSYETELKSWGEIKDLIADDFSLDNMKVVESINKTQLVHPDTVLPAEDFVLFLRQVKNKAGVDFSEMSFKELRAYAKEHNLESMITDRTGINYTRVSTDQLKEVLTDYYSEGDAAPEPTEEVKETYTENECNTNLCHVDAAIESIGAITGISAIKVLKKLEKLKSKIEAQKEEITSGKTDAELEAAAADIFDELD